jgi:ATP adenylyltransferase
MSPVKRIWAPWRMRYIKGPKEDECIFCFDPSLDEERHVLRREEFAFVLLNKYPYTNGHLLVVPTKHASHPKDLDDKEYQALTALLLFSMTALEKVLVPHGMNVGMNLGRVAGAGVDEHLHFHIVPRWDGDHNYVAVLGEVRVINEHLDDTYRQLKPAFK